MTEAAHNVVNINEEMRREVDAPGSAQGGASDLGNKKNDALFKIGNIPDRIKNNKYASAHWKFLTENLKNAGAIMRMYKPAIMLACINYSLLMKAHDGIVERAEREIGGELKKGESLLDQMTPNGYKAMSAEIINYSKYLKIVNADLKTFGMTPTSIKDLGDPKQLGLPFIT